MTVVASWSSSVVAVLKPMNPVHGPDLQTVAPGLRPLGEPGPKGLLEAAFDHGQRTRPVADSFWGGLLVGTFVMLAWTLYAVVVLILVPFIDLIPGARAERRDAWAAFVGLLHRRGEPRGRHRRGNPPG